jgi:pimeloyl-ACP methyl ester carboxylesterase
MKRACILMLGYLFAVPAAAQQLQLTPRTLRLGDDEVAAEFGFLKVPADHMHPATDTFQLAVARLRSTSAQPAPPIVFLAGGPGASGIAAARINYFAELFTRLRSAADVILIDQRGTGQSNPATVCTADELPPRDVFATQQQLAGYYAERVRTCVAEWRTRGVDAAHFDTQQSAADITHLRRALGVEQIQLLGFSYGTHLGLAVLRADNAGIARAVLAGVEGPDHNWKLPSTGEKQLDMLARLVRADSALGPEIPDLKGTLQDVLARFDQQPRQVEVNRPGGGFTQLTIGADGLRYLLARDLGDTNDLPNYPAWIWTMAHGNDAGLKQYAARRWAELRTVSVMSVATDCASDASAERKARVRREAEQATLRDALNMWFSERCAASATPTLGADFRTPINSAVPTLFISGSLDSQTPPGQVEEVRRGFTRSAHIRVENAGHESTLPSSTVQQLIERFVRGETVRDTTLTLPALRFRALPR